MTKARTSFLGMLLALFGCKPAEEQQLLSNGMVFIGGTNSPIERAIREENYILAEKLARDMVHDAPHDHVGHIVLGQVQLVQEKYVDAASSFDKAIQIAPHDTIALYGRGLVAQEQEEFETAKEFYERVLAIDAKSFEAHFGMAAACEGLELHALVIKHAERFLQLAPDSQLADEAREMIAVAQSAAQSEFEELESAADVQMAVDEAISHPRAIIFMHVDWAPLAAQRQRFFEFKLVYQAKYPEHDLAFRYIDCTTVSKDYEPLRSLAGWRELEKRQGGSSLVHGYGELAWIQNGRVIHVERPLASADKLIEKTEALGMAGNAD